MATNSIQGWLKRARDEEAKNGGKRVKRVETSASLDAIPIELYDMIVAESPLESILALSLVSQSIPYQTPRPEVTASSASNKDSCSRTYKNAPERRSKLQTPRADQATRSLRRGHHQAGGSNGQPISPKTLTCSLCKVLKANSADGFQDTQFKAAKLDRVCLEGQPRKDLKLKKKSMFACQFCKQAKELRSLAAIDVQSMRATVKEKRASCRPVFFEDTITKINAGNKMCSPCYEELLFLLKVKATADLVSADVVEGE